MRRADAAAHEERGLLLERLDRLAGPPAGSPEPVASGAEVVPFRADA
jgi:hypothetical protein